MVQWDDFGYEPEVEREPDAYEASAIETHAELAKKVAKELALPIDAPNALAEGTMTRFEKWHQKKL